MILKKFSTTMAMKKSNDYIENAISRHGFEFVLNVRREKLIGCRGRVNLIENTMSNR